MDPSVNTILLLSAKERYQNFITSICERGAVWSLRNGHTWCSMAMSDGTVVQPFWPAAAHAAACAAGAWEEYTPEHIPLHTFISSWLPGMAERHTLVSVFPTCDDSGTLRSALGLQAAINDLCPLLE